MRIDLPRLRWRISGLVVLRWLVFFGGLAGAALLWRHHAVGAVALGVLVLVAAAALHAWETGLRRQFIRDAELPAYVTQQLLKEFPHLQARDAELVLRGLRQFFMAHLRARRQFVAMPSKVVDAAWHAFILHTRGYQRWCGLAFGGMLHHTPATVLGTDARRNDGLRRSWCWACKEESIDPRTPTRLPLLFALDTKFGIPGGFVYVPDCRAVDRHDGSPAHCGSSFGGSSDGGGGGGDAPGDGGGFGGSDGGGDGGGCGGGGD